MTLKDTLRADMLTALKAKDTLRTTTLRTVIGLIDNAESSGKTRKVLTDDEVTVLMRKEVKKRRDTAAEYTERAVLDRAERETAEADIIDAYLPQIMSEADTRALVAKVITETGAEGPKGIGAIMKAVGSDKTVDRALVSAIAREMLGL